MTPTVERDLFPGVEVEYNVEATMRDGCILRADVYRPTGGGEHPVLLQRVPYDKSVAQSIVYHHPSWYARQGYVVVVQDTRGRFSSEGTFDPLRTEARDGYDTIQWAAELPGSSGRVGTYGFSYSGATQLLAATQQPPALACCAPGFTSSDYYSDWTYEGGALNLAFIVSWTVQLLAIPDALRRGLPDAALRLAEHMGSIPQLYSQRPLEKFPLLSGTGVAPFFFDWLAHDRRDDYWQEISLEHRFDAIKVPCLHFGGFYDIFATGTVNNYVQLARDAAKPGAHRLVMGPWLHIPWAPAVGNQDFGPYAANRVNELQLDWFNQWLKPADHIVRDKRPVEIFLMGANEWRAYDAWPPAESHPEKWFLHSDGGANSRSGDGQLNTTPPGDEAADIYVYNPAAPAPSAGGKSCCDPSVTPMGPACQQEVEQRNDVLLYTSDPLEQPTDVIGDVTLVLHAASSAVDTDWVARLVDVDQQGRAVNVCQGILRARFRDSREDPTALEPGKCYEYTVPLGPTSWRFGEGHRLRVQVTSSDFPAHDVNPNTGGPLVKTGLLDGVVAAQVVHHDRTRPSHVLLPVVTDKENHPTTQARSASS